MDFVFIRPFTFPQWKLVKRQKKVPQTEHAGNEAHLREIPTMTILRGYILTLHPPLDLRSPRPTKWGENSPNKFAH
jgi:hypothetical protein